MRLKALHSLPKPPSISDRSNFIKRRRELKELLTAVYVASFIYRQHSTSPEQYLKNSFLSSPVELKTFAHPTILKLDQHKLYAKGACIIFIAFVIPRHKF
jgi:hypothetical protein